jgi:hypothetical protein
MLRATSLPSCTPVARFGADVVGRDFVVVVFFALAVGATEPVCISWVGTDQSHEVYSVSIFM